MPIKPEYRQFYGKEWREVIRPRIIARAMDHCEQCGAPNHQYVLRGEGGYWRPDEPGQFWRNIRNANPPTQQFRHEHPWAPRRIRTVYIVLGVAHLNHTPGDDRDNNLMALCQSCHLARDATKHKETRSIRKDLTRPLLQEPHARI